MFLYIKLQNYFYAGQVIVSKLYNHRSRSLFKYEIDEDLYVVANPT